MGAARDTQSEPAVLRTVEARQEYIVLTQTITRPTTTLTKYVTLGTAPPPEPDPGSSGAGGGNNNPDTGNAGNASPGATTPPSITGSDSSLTSGQIFAILGSLGAFVLLSALIWHCLTIRRGRRRHRFSGYGSMYGSSYFSGSSERLPEPRSPRPRPPVPLWSNRRPRPPPVPFWSSRRPGPPPSQGRPPMQPPPVPFGPQFPVRRPEIIYSSVRRNI